MNIYCRSSSVAFCCVFCPSSDALLRLFNSRNCSRQTPIHKPSNDYLQKEVHSNLLGSDHSKCEDSLVAHGRWSLTRIDKQGVPSEARSQRIIFRRSLIACNSFFLFIYFSKRSGDYTTSWWNFCDILNLSQRFFAALGKCIKRWLKTAIFSWHI